MNENIPLEQPSFFDIPTDFIKYFKGNFTFPKYKYAGPGNPLDNGEPLNNPLDIAAEKHDHAYNKLIMLGQKPYSHWSKADEEFLNEIGGDTSWQASISRGVFNVKKFLYDIHILGAVKENTSSEGIYT